MNHKEGSDGNKVRSKTAIKYRKILIGPSQGPVHKLVSPSGEVVCEADLGWIHLFCRAQIISDLDVSDHVGLAIENLHFARGEDSDWDDYLDRARSTLEELANSLFDEDEDGEEECDDD